MMKALQKMTAWISAAAILLCVFTGCAEKSSVSAEKPVILTVSFGTSFNDSRDKTIGAIEKTLQETYGDYEVRRAFTSQIIIDKLKERDNLEIDNVEEALDRLVEDGVKTLVVQPTHIMSGFEYDDLAKAVEEYRTKFDHVEMGTPLLTSDADYTALAGVLSDIAEEYKAEDTAVVFMGHGTEHEANEAYPKLQQTLLDSGEKDIFIGTVEAKPDLEDILASLKEGQYKKVVLQPLMVVAGDHANNDMAGDEDDSWKSILTKEGYTVECVIKGLGEYPAIQKMYAEHTEEAIEKIKKEQ